MITTVIEIVIITNKDKGRRRRRRKGRGDGEKREKVEIEMETKKNLPLTIPNNSGFRILIFRSLTMKWEILDFDFNVLIFGISL